MLSWWPFPDILAITSVAYIELALISWHLHHTSTASTHLRRMTLDIIVHLFRDIASIAPTHAKAVVLQLPAFRLFGHAQTLPI
jgi:hypothetical protein